MRKSLTILLCLVCMAYITGCGGGATSSVTTTYDKFPVPHFEQYTSVVKGRIPNGPLAFNNFTGSRAFKNYSVSTRAGSSAGFTNRTSAVNPAAQFNRPLGITADAKNLYVADYLNNAIRMIDVNGYVRTVAGVLGLAGSANTADGIPSFNLPRDITTDGKSLYIADSGNYTIRKIDMTTSPWTVTLLAGGVGLPGSVDALKGTDARFNVINGITTDGQNLYVTDSNNTIRRIVIASPSPVTTVAGTPDTIGSTDGIARNPATARFNLPNRLTIDGRNLYVTDFGNSTIRKIDLNTGDVTTIAGQVWPGGAAGLYSDSTDGTGNTARFNHPNGITTDGVNLYVTESFNSRIRKIVISGKPGSVYSGAVTTIAGRDSTIKGGLKEGYGTVATFNTPVGITTDGTSLYIVDNLNHRIRKIQSGN